MVAPAWTEQYVVVSLNRFITLENYLLEAEKLILGSIGLIDWLRFIFL